MLDWPSDLRETQSIAYAAGLRALESLQFAGIGVVGHFGERVSEHRLHFAKEFGAS
jgi:hypothetical protein